MPDSIASVGTNPLVKTIATSLRERNRISAELFPREARRLAVACKEMAERFLRGGRLLAFGRGPAATDAQHVSVEFVHPVIVGKRALPALDLSLAFQSWLPAIVRAEDVVMGFGPPGGDPEVAAALGVAREAGAQVFSLPGDPASWPEPHYAVASPSGDPFVHQELIEVLYHTLWETVHVFFEHRESGHDVGDAGFLYPYLGKERQDTTGVVDTVAASIEAKARDDERMREEVATEQAEAIAAAARAIAQRVAAGGTLILFGNGGSATDANDWALDCVTPPPGSPAIPAVSLAMEPANISAISNDVGAGEVFLRQLVAQARPGSVSKSSPNWAPDVAIGISTSGGSANVIAALEEAGKRGMLRLALLGYDGGEIVRRNASGRPLAEHPLVVHSDYIPRIQEVQASIYHVLLDAVRAILADDGTGVAR